VARDVKLAERPLASDPRSWINRRIELRRTSMTLAQWLPFAIASAILVAIPGPTVLLVVSYALGHGRKYAFATTLGVALGDLTAMTASMLGLGVLLAASAELFMVVKWIGAAYLIYLGIKLWNAPVVDADAVQPTGDLRTSRIMAHAYAVTTLNPKSIIFFVAYALLASGARKAIRKASVQRAVNRTGGALLMGAGVFAAAWKKAT
jgi:threonine/homoserine/homoserine lactone efflux protein